MAKVLHAIKHWFGAYINKTVIIGKWSSAEVDTLQLLHGHKFLILTLAVALFCLFSYICCESQR
jgi:hypothetical protein